MANIELYNQAIQKGFRPDPLMTFSQWAEKYFILPPGSAVPGLIQLDRTPYLRQILDDLSWTSPVREQVVIKGTQLGLTTVSDIVLQVTVDLFPAPVLMLFGSDAMGDEHVKTRVEPSLETNPRLKGKVSDAFDKRGKTTRRLKVFPGGSLKFAGGATGKSFRMYSAAIVIIDDVDALKMDIGGTAEKTGEGNPLKLAKSRTDARGGKYKLYFSGTPTDTDTSLIFNAWRDTDQQFFYVPCPECNHYQIIDFFRIKYTADRRTLKSVEGLECEACKKIIPEQKKTWMVTRGQWRSTKDSPNNLKVGRSISSAYSLLGFTWWDMCAEWLDAMDVKDRGDLTLMSHFYNTRLALPWDATPGEKVEHSALFNRRETYDLVPDPVAVVTAGIDVQINRLEVTVLGFSEFERWGIQHKIIGGDPKIKYGVKGSVWNDLETYLNQTFENDDSTKMPINLSCIDTGNWTNEVMHFLNKPQIKARRWKIYGIKGASTPGKQLVSNPNKEGVFLLGTDQAKENIFYQLQTRKPGPGFIHFNESFGEEYFKQLTVEELRHKFVNGHKVRYWYCPKHARNEALDCTVYALAACHILNPDYEAVIKNRKAALDTPKRNKTRPKRSNFATNWTQ
jgi:phage terminase large subunit GpA-like protein